MALIAEWVPRLASKLETARLLGDSTLAGELGLGTVDEDALYEAMDWLGERQERIKRRLAKRHLAEGGQALHDVSSSYCEGPFLPAGALRPQPRRQARLSGGRVRLAGRCRRAPSGGAGAPRQHGRSEHTAGRGQAAAHSKKAHGTTSDGLPLHSFSSLMAHNATRCRLKADPDAPAFDRDTEPTPLQRRALELVRSFPVNFTIQELFFLCNQQVESFPQGGTSV